MTIYSIICCYHNSLTPKAFRGGCFGSLCLVGTGENSSFGGSVSLKGPEDFTAEPFQSGVASGYSHWYETSAIGWEHYRDGCSVWAILSVCVYVEWWWTFQRGFLQFLWNLWRWMKPQRSYSTTMLFCQINMHVCVGGCMCVCLACLTSFMSVLAMRDSGFEPEIMYVCHKYGSCHC